MEYYFEEKRRSPNGIQYPFTSNIQTQVGPGVMARAHIHDYIEILYCIEGVTNVYLGNTTYIFKKGDLIIMNSREIHNVVTTYEGTTKYIVVQVDPALLYTTTQSIFEAKYVLPFTLSNAQHQRLFNKDELEATIVPKLLMDIVNEFSQKKYGYELAVRTNISQLFLWILRHWHEQGIKLDVSSDISESAMKRLQLAFDYVESNYQNNISVEDVAKMCGMSYSYFSRFFKSVMKRNFSDYLNSVRITAAEKLLTTTDKNVTEIAMEVGFSTSSYFIHQFKLHKDISPKQYRKIFSLQK